jgi:hypothetical protein
VKDLGTIAFAVDAIHDDKKRIEIPEHACYSLTGGSPNRSRELFT